MEAQVILQCNWTEKGKKMKCIIYVRGIWDKVNFKSFISAAAAETDK